MFAKNLLKLSQMSCMSERTVSPSRRLTGRVDFAFGAKNISLYYTILGYLSCWLLWDLCNKLSFIFNKCVGIISPEFPIWSGIRTGISISEAYNLFHIITEPIRLLGSLDYVLSQMSMFANYILKMFLPVVESFIWIIKYFT